MTMSFPAVVDYSYGRPSPDYIRNSGYIGALRYLGHDGRCLTKGEANGLLAAGLGIGLIYEEAASACLGGWNTGVQHANNANRYADEVGAPNVPIFYAVDFQPNHGQLYGPIVEYFRGAMSVGGREVRAYGCASVMQCLCGDVKLFPDSWQCAAWSYPGTAPGTPISDGGWNLVLSPYASMLQCIGYVLQDTSDHNNMITADRSFMWGMEDEDVMTDDDWNHLTAIVGSTVLNKFAMHNVQGNLIEDDDGQYFITVAGDGTLRRYHPRSAEEANALQVVGFLAKQKPENPPANCPSVFNARDLPDPIRDALKAIPWAGGSKEGADDA
jgi:hypothetical protein